LPSWPIEASQNTDIRKKRRDGIGLGGGGRGRDLAEDSRGGEVGHNQGTSVCVTVAGSGTLGGNGGDVVGLSRSEGVRPPCIQQEILELLEQPLTELLYVMYDWALACQD